MSKRKVEALKAIAQRGGTDNERRIASEKLSQAKPSNGLARTDEVTGANRYTGQGVITRHRNGAKAYIRGESLAEFLNQIKDGKEFTNRTVGYSQEFGPGDFYVVLSWLLDMGVCVKAGSRYTVPNVKTVRDAWNQQVESMKL